VNHTHTCRSGSRTDVPSCGRSRSQDDSTALAAGSSTPAGHRRHLRGKEPAYFPLTSPRGSGRQLVTWPRVTSARTRCTARRRQDVMTVVTASWSSIIIIISITLISSSSNHSYISPRRRKTAARHQRLTLCLLTVDAVSTLSVNFTKA